LHPWEVTLAEMLGEAGYRTAMFGKWHLGAGRGRLPTDQGFDEWFGFETTDIIYWSGNPGMPLKDVDYVREAWRDSTVSTACSRTGPSRAPSIWLRIRRAFQHHLAEHLDR
jgi:arylsulfatase A-like enzyme